MSNKYLNYDGVAYFWEKVKGADSGKVDKETGKGLSSNDYTTAEKTKLSGIETGAQANVIEGIQTAGSTVTPVNKIINIPQMTGASSSAAGTVGLVPAPAAGSQEKFLRGDGSWAVVTSNVNADWAQTDSTQADYIKNKPSIPDSTSDLTNDSGFITSADVPTASSTTPAMDGTGSAGSGTTWARADHVHPTDTSRAPLASPALTGTPTAPTAAAGTNTTQIATTAFVKAAVPTASSTTPAMDGAAAVGTGTTWARADHVHPTDTSRAPLASPALTGTPTAPTATAGTNTTQIATTAFVTSAVAAAQSGAAMFKGVASDGIPTTNYKAGWYWLVDVAGTYVGQTCEIGDMIFCVENYSSAFSNSDFTVIQNNLDLIAITNAEIDAICV